MTLDFDTIQTWFFFIEVTNVLGALSAMCLFGAQLILCFLSYLFHLINLIELALGIVDMAVIHLALLYKNILYWLATVSETCDCNIIVLLWPGLCNEVKFGSVKLWSESLGSQLGPSLLGDHCEDLDHMLRNAVVATWRGVEEASAQPLRADGHWSKIHPYLTCQSGLMPLQTSYLGSSSSFH